MNAMKDKTVSVPINPSDVLNTLSILPRTPADAGLAVVQLKRRLNYPSVHNQQLINFNKVVKALKTFINMGNPHYKNIMQDKEFKKRCFSSDPEGYKFLFPEDDIDVSSLELNSQKVDEAAFSDLNIQSQNHEKSKQDSTQTEEHDSKKEEEEDEDEEYEKKDSIGKTQFNYNRSTCFGENMPKNS